jgi:hypothetical protein
VLRLGCFEVVEIRKCSSPDIELITLQEHQVELWQFRHGKAER